VGVTESDKEVFMPKRSHSRFGRRAREGVVGVFVPLDEEEVEDLLSSVEEDEYDEDDGDDSDEYE
jgi:hypothetical protein